ncbi:uncharacterized protein METZ01_LOCUS429323, partial [marine metagenome]
MKRKSLLSAATAEATFVGSVRCGHSVSMSSLDSVLFLPLKAVPMIVFGS